jgi:hypothetical protein
MNSLTNETNVCMEMAKRGPKTPLYLPDELWELVIERDVRTAAVGFSVNKTLHAVALRALQLAPPNKLCRYSRIPSVHHLKDAFVVGYGAATEMRKLYVAKKKSYAAPCSRKALNGRHIECLAPLVLASGCATGLIERKRKKHRRDALVAECRSRWADLLTFKELEALCEEAVTDGGDMDELTAKVDAHLEEKRLKEIADRERAEAERAAHEAECAAREQRRLEWEVRQAARTEAARPTFETLQRLAAESYPRSLCARDMETLCWGLAFSGKDDDPSLFRAVQLQRCRTHELRCKRVVDGVRCKGRCPSTIRLICDGCGAGMSIFV